MEAAVAVERKQETPQIICHFCSPSWLPYEDRKTLDSNRMRMQKRCAAKRCLHTGIHALLCVINNAPFKHPLPVRGSNWFALHTRTHFLCVEWESERDERPLLDRGLSISVVWRAPPASAPPKEAENAMLTGGEGSGGGGGKSEWREHVEGHINCLFFASASFISPVHPSFSLPCIASPLAFCFLSFRHVTTHIPEDANGCLLLMLSAVVSGHSSKMILKATNVWTLSVYFSFIFQWYPQHTLLRVILGVTSLKYLFDTLRCLFVIYQSFCN